MFLKTLNKRGNMNNELLKMPKVELHMHLDGSIPIYVLEKLSGLSYEEQSKD